MNKPENKSEALAYTQSFATTAPNNSRWENCEAANILALLSESHNLDVVREQLLL